MKENKGKWQNTADLRGKKEKEGKKNRQVQKRNSHRQ